MLNSEERIVSVSDKNVVLCDSTGKCIASSNPRKVGENIKLPADIFAEGRLLNKTSGNNKNIMVPLNCPYKVRAFLVMDRQHKNEIPVIKNFAEMLVREHLETPKPNHYSIDEFISGIIKDGAPADQNESNEQIKSIGLNITIPRSAIVIELKGFEDMCLEDVNSTSSKEEIICAKKNAIEFAINSFFTRNKDLFTAYLGKDRFVVFKAVPDDETERFAELMKKSYTAIFYKLKSADIDKVSVAFGSPYAKIDGIVNSFNEAELTLNVTNNKSQQAVYYYGDLGILKILADGDREKKMGFANKIIDRIDDPALLETLEAFFECNLSITDTADRMKIHRNTVIYRLNKLNETLELDPRIINEAIMIQSALLIKRTFASWD